MRKGCIITFNQALNYGAVLQMYALQRVTEEIIGNRCDIVNYYSSYFADLYRNRKGKDYFNIRFWKNLIKDNSPKKYNVKGFVDFCSKYIHYCNGLYTREKIPLLNQEYEVFISGSDQVFNPLCSGMDRTFFLDFVDDKNIKASYAASLGFSEIPDSCREYINLLSDFDFLSIREKSSASVLQSFLSHNNIKDHIDPTLLLTRSKWETIADESLCPSYKYLLIYAINEDKKMLKYAEKCAKAMGCKAIYLSDRYVKPIGFKTISGVTPEQWLGFFLNAEFVVTNSFHGVAFSINFHKNFSPYMLTSNTIINTRVCDLLSMLDLKYLLKREVNYNIKINYEAVDKIIDYERKKSVEYLKEVLEIDF